MLSKWKKKCQLFINNLQFLTKCQQNSNLLLCAWFYLGWMGRSLKVALSLLSSPWPVGWSFIYWVTFLWPRSPPNAAWQSEKKRNGLCCKLDSEILFGTCKLFPPQVMLPITKLCLQPDWNVCVFGAGYMSCTKSVSKFVFKHTGASSVFQLRLGMLPINS